MIKKRAVFLLPIFFAVGILFFDIASVRSLDYVLLEPIPGTSSNADMPSYISGIYKFALWSVGIAAMFMITIGGVMYLTSAGNTSAMGNAKGVITDAIIGLVLAISAWFLLNFINPDLLSGDLTIFDTMGIQDTAADTTESIKSGESTNPTGSTTCASCSIIPATVPHKTCNRPTCQLNTTLLSKIQSISGVTGWRITESYPPTVNHLAKCHLNGTCADLNNSGGSTSPSAIKSYYDAFKAAGLNVLYESKNCAPYIAAGVTNCKAYPTMNNGSSFHVR